MRNQRENKSYHNLRDSLIHACKYGSLVASSLRTTGKDMLPSETALTTSARSFMYAAGLVKRNSRVIRTHVAAESAPFRVLALINDVWCFAHLRGFATEIHSLPLDD
jgi:hypothetical protein